MSRSIENRARFEGKEASFKHVLVDVCATSRLRAREADTRCIGGTLNDLLVMLSCGTLRPIPSCMSPMAAVTTPGNSPAGCLSNHPMSCGSANIEKT